MKARHILIFLVALGGCSTQNDPVSPSDARARFDGGLHMVGSGNLAATATSGSDSTSYGRGLHMIGSGN